MKKKHLINVLNSFKKSLTNAVTPEGQALIEEINGVLAEMQGDPDVEFNEADVLAKVQELASKSGAAAATEVVNALKNDFNKKDKVMDVKEMRNAFAKAMRNSAGKGKGAFAKAFESELAANGVSGLPTLLEVFPEIQTKFEQTSILSKLRKLGNYSLKISVSTQADDDADVRAKGHADLTAVKGNQALILTPKTLSLGAIYKKINVPKLMSYETGNDTALFSWLANELVERIDNEIQRVILVGDGRASNHADKISSFETIGIKTAADAYTVYAESTNALPTLEETRNLVDTMDITKPISMYAHPSIITAMQKFIYASGGSTTFIDDNTLAGLLGVSEIIRTKMLAGAVPGTVSKVPAIVLIQHESYGYVGNDLFSVDFEKWEYNEDIFMAEIFAGGGIIKPLSTGLIRISKTA